MIRFKKYRDFARKAHASQIRDVSADPYYMHCERVAAIISAIPAAGEVEVGAAFLHDVIEDTHFTFHDLRELFGLRVAGIVDELTNVFTHESYQHLNRAERKEREFARLGETGDIWVRRIKAADRLDNLHEIDPKADFTKVYVAESKLLVDALAYRQNDDYLSDLLHQILAAVRELS